MKADRETLGVDPLLELAIVYTRQIRAGIERIWEMPLLVEFDGEEYRILALKDGTLVAHSTTCPHWLGPIDKVMPQQGILRCPWHGYLFDLRTGASADGRGYRLAPAPQVVVDPVTSEVSLARAAPDP